MCRMFGFKSVIPSQVHNSLVDADNALGFQSKKIIPTDGVLFIISTVRLILFVVLKQRTMTNFSIESAVL